MQDLNIFKNSYLIIGGPNSKKSEVSLYISKDLNYKLINLDREKYSFLEDFTDFDSTKYFKFLEKSIESSINYIHKYEMVHLENVLNNIDRPVVIDFGNTYTLIKENSILNKIKMFENIVLLYSNKAKKTNLDQKLSNNKILHEISTIKINIDSKSIEDIVKEIKNNIEFKNIL